MKRFDLVIIGGGVAGLVSASGAARLGARVALIERESLGGDCLRTGCVPTKRLIRSARMASLMRRAAEFGIEGEFKVDFLAVMEKMRRVQSEIGRNDDPERFRRMGVELMFGRGRFSGRDTFEINGESLKGRRFIIATGSSPAPLPIPGLNEAGSLTNESALRLKELPRTLAIIGGGPIGVEFAQVFARLGSSVTVIEKGGQLLSREDAEVSEMLKGMLEAEGIGIEVSTGIKDIALSGTLKSIYARGPRGDRVFEAEEVMTAAGRSPNVGGLDLEVAGVAYDGKRGIKVDRTLRTSNRNIYACGDCVGQYAFTHVAEYQAGIALGNALFPFLKRKVDYRVVPWTTFTDPELARVGLTEREARERYGKRVRVYRYFFKDVDRANIEGEGKGVIKLVCEGRGIVGAHILGPGGGELIHEYVLAMKKNIPITEISKTIHVYPTLAQGLKRASDEYYRERLFGGWFPRLAGWIIRRGG